MNSPFLYYIEASPDLLAISLQDGFRNQRDTGL